MTAYPYSITDLERHSGIKAHTIRMWERRYNIIDPHRDEHNVRHYAEPDLQRVVKIGRLCREGHRISALAGLSKRELDTLYQKVVLCSGSDCVIIDKLLEVVMAAQESMLYEMLDERFEALGALSFAKDIWQATQERMSVLILSGVMHNIHLRLFDQVTAQLFAAKNLELMRSKLLCVGSALLLNTCGSLSPLYHCLTRHLMIKKGYDVVSMTLCQSDWASLKSIMSTRKFDHIYIHYQAIAFDQAPPFDTITPWIPTGCEVVMYGALHEDITLPNGWVYKEIDEHARSIDSASSYVLEVDEQLRSQELL